MKITNIPSWLGSSKRELPITTIVLHATAGKSAESSISWLWRLLKNGKKGDDASYHFIIDRNGDIWKCVPYRDRAAWHAGVSVGPPALHRAVNQSSIGIAFANLNNGVERLTDAQIKACIELCNALCFDVPTIRFLTTHFGCADPLLRKTDPKLFDMRVFNALLKRPLQVWKRANAPWTTQ